MKAKVKKQKRKLTVSVIAILLVVWIVVSAVFCYIVINDEKDKLIAKEQQSFSRLLDRMNGYSHLSHGNICFSVESAVEHLDSYLMDDEPQPKATYGAYPLHDNNMHVVAFSSSYDANDKGETYTKNTVIMDSDKYDYVLFVSTNDDNHTYREGKIEYDSFRESIDDSQYKEISKYLNTQADENGDYYMLICTEFYYTSPGIIDPKTVGVIKVDIDDEDFEKTKIIKEYELSPKIAENSLLLKSELLENPNIIPGDFVVGNYSSGGLIEDIYGSVDPDSFDIYNGQVEKVDMFTYTYENINTMVVGAISEKYENDFIEDYIPMGEETLKNEFVVVRYKHRFNVLESCQNMLLTGVIAAFIFFFVIGLILIISARHIITTHAVEEEKRRQVTNALAHDIKSPLFIISGYAQNLSEDINSEKRAHYANRIIERSNEINDIVHKMLDFSNINSDSQQLLREDVKFSELIYEVTEDIEALNGEKKINLNISDDCIVNADRSLMKRVVSYLFDNAVKYSDDNTSIDVVLTDKYFSISNVCSFITDSDMKHIFEPYFKVDKNRNTKGNGLGLSIVRSIVDLHKFKMNSNLKNHVVTFTIEF